jgi:hypothetical protein
MRRNDAIFSWFLVLEWVRIRRLLLAANLQNGSILDDLCTNEIESSVVVLIFVSSGRSMLRSSNDHGYYQYDHQFGVNNNHPYHLYEKSDWHGFSIASNVPTLYCTAMLKIITVRSPYHPTQAIPSDKNPNIVASSPSLSGRQRWQSITGYKKHRYVKQRYWKQNKSIKLRSINWIVSRE